MSRLAMAVILTVIVIADIAVIIDWWSGSEMVTVTEVKTRHEAELLAIPGVVGVGEGRDRIVVYVVSEDVIPRVPTVLEGIPVQVVVTGEFRALG